MLIEVTQFLRPNGRHKLETTELPDKIRFFYEEMKTYGCRFESEILQTGHVSVTITHPRYGDVDISLTNNGPEIQEGMVAMLKREPWTTMAEEEE